MAFGRRSSFRPLAVTLITMVGLVSASSHAEVTTYTGPFSGTIAVGDTALLNDNASVSGNVANSGTLQFNMSGTSAVADNAVISGTGLVRMTGSGTVTNLFDAQTYTGNTQLENGTLRVNYNDRLGNTSSGVTFDGGRLQITNSGVVSTFSTARSMSLVSVGTIDTSTLANGSYDQPAFTGVISGAGTLTLAAHGLGNGATDAYLRLGGTSTYSGTTRITSGMVYASSTSAFGTSTVVLDGGGLVAPNAVTVDNALVLAGTDNFVRAWSGDTMNLGGVISGTGGLQKTDSGTVNLNAANTYTGDTRILAGTLNAANYAALAGTTLDMQAGDTGSIGFTVAQTGTYQIGGLTGSRAINNGGDTLAIGGNGTSTTYSGTLSGAGGLIKTGAGTLTLTGSNIYTGATTVSAGTLTIGGGGNGVLSIGNDGTGTLNVTGGSVTSGAGFLGSNAGSVGAATVSSGTWANGNSGLSLVVGDSGTGTLDVTGGSVTNAMGILGSNSGGVGTATVSSGAWANGELLIVGNFGTGTLNVSGGSVTSASGELARNPGGVGTVTVSSGTWANSGNLSVGTTGTGTLNVTGGSVTNSFCELGYYPSSVGIATVSSGTWANRGNLTVGVSGTGTLTMSGGLVTVGGTLSRGTNGTINLNTGGTLQIGTGGTTGVLATNLTNNGRLVFNRSDNSTYSGTISGNGSVAKQGSGTLTLAGANTYTGLTWVREGTLAMGLSNAVAAASDLTVDSGATFDRAGFAQTVMNAAINGTVANTGGGGLLSVTGTLSGSGLLNGDVTVAGIHAPGTSPGTQTFSGDLTYTAGATVNWELVANSTGDAGTNYDQIAMPTGNLAFSGATTLGLSFDGSGSTVVWSDPFWDSNRAWLVYDLGTGTTTGDGNLLLGGSLLDSLGNALLAARGAFSTSLLGQDVVLNYTAVPVPEPATCAVALTGIACGGYSIWRRRKQA